MSNLPDSPVADVLGIVLGSLYPGRTQVGVREAIAPKDKTDLLVVSYRCDFAALWAMNEEFLAWLTSRPRTIILVWDETPTGGLGDVALNEYVTAFDWSVALCLLADEYTRTLKKTPQWRLLIADLSSKKHPSAHGVRLFDAFQRPNALLIPWIQSFRVDDFSSMLDCLRESPEKHEDTIDLDVLRNTWAAMLVNPAKPSERHAIVNLVAPRLLLSGMRRDIGKAKAASPPIVNALETLMRAVELIPEAAERSVAPWVSPLKWKAIVDKFVLIDDMADLGWKDFLSAALGAQQDQIEALTDPHQWQRIPEQDGIILFLDLRLFAGRPGDELGFFKELAEAATSFRIKDDEPSDSGFHEADIRAIRRVVETGVRDSEASYYTALTFLPRLLSLKDPTLPIVIFSSTGRKEIAEALRPFGNIVLGFDKPRFFGDANNAVLEKRVKGLRRPWKDCLS